MYTPSGVFYIRRIHGVPHAMLEGEPFCAFTSPGGAHSALITGNTGRSMSGIVFRLLGRTTLRFR